MQKIQKKGSGWELTGKPTENDPDLNRLYVVVANTLEQAEDLVVRKELPNPVRWLDYVKSVLNSEETKTKHPDYDIDGSVLNIHNSKIMKESLLGFMGSGGEKLTLIIDIETIDDTDNKHDKYYARPPSVLTFLATNYWFYDPSCDLEVDVRNRSVSVPSLIINSTQQQSLYYLSQYCS